MGLTPKGAPMATDKRPAQAANDAANKQAEPRSTVPDCEYIVHQVRNSQPWDFTTQEGLCAYGNAVVVALHAEDANFGHLRKDPGQTHCVDPQGSLCARDVALWKPSGQIIDYIVSGGYATPPPPNEVCWIVGEYGEYMEPDGSVPKWYAPVAGEGGGGSTGGGDVNADVQAQLDRMEAMLTAQGQTIAQMELFLSNMNEQLALGMGEINNIRANQNPPYAGPQGKPGDTLTLHAQQG
jgi:hypothetical protein